MNLEAYKQVEQAQAELQSAIKKKKAEDTDEADYAYQQALTRCDNARAEYAVNNSEYKPGDIVIWKNDDGEYQAKVVLRFAHTPNIKYKVNIIQTISGHHIDVGFAYESQLKHLSDMDDDLPF